MSFKAFVWAWDQPLEKDEHLIVLLALADIANESGSLFASHAYIAKHARKNERTVRRALVAMEGSTISITERPGRTDLIRLNIPDTFMVSFHKEEEHEQGKRGRPRKTLAKVSENPGLGDEKPPAPVSYEPKTLTGDGTSLDLSPLDAFDVWWAIYPRKVAKVAARKVWRAVQAKIGIEDLAELTRRFADHVVGKDPEFIAHPAKWLKDERWNDELHPRGGQTDGNRRAASIDHAADRADSRLQAMVEGARQALDGGRRQRWRL